MIGNRARVIVILRGIGQGFSLPMLTCALPAAHGQQAGGHRHWWSKHRGQTFDHGAMRS